MSDKVDTALKEVEAGHSVTRAVNDGMSRSEQLEFARRLWDNGTNSRMDQGSMKFTRDVGPAEVTFRRGKDGEREVADIVFSGTRDLYDTPDEVRAIRAAASAPQMGSKPSHGFGSPGDTRYSSPPERRAGSSAADPLAEDYKKCMDGAGKPGKVEISECMAVTGYTPPNVRIEQVRERKGVTEGEQ